jgi:hypothetical protein
MQSALLQFESAAFTVEPGEDEQTNPGIYGKALAEWIGDRLRAQGLQVQEVFAEDFGWCVPVRVEPYRLIVACANQSDKRESWQVFVSVTSGLLRRLLGKDRRGEALAHVFGAMKHALESSQIIRGLSEESSHST